MQEDLTVSGNKITGTLKYIDSGTLATDWGPGYFMALKFTGIDSDAEKCMVGLEPSVSSGLVDIIPDPDKNGAFKVTDKKLQKFKIHSTGNGHSNTQYFDLSGLVLEDTGV
jgi:hypothetical protein